MCQLLSCVAFSWGPDKLMRSRDLVLDTEGTGSYSPNTGAESAPRRDFPRVPSLSRHDKGSTRDTGGIPQPDTGERRHRREGAVESGLGASELMQETSLGGACLQSQLFTRQRQEDH